MQQLFKLSFIIFLLSIYCFCNAQQIVQSVNDLKKIKSNEQSFIGKPLKMLLKEIKPEIKMVTVRESSAEALGAFIFNFVDSAQYKKYNLEKKYPLAVTVFVKEKLVWYTSDKPIAERQIWTKEDERKYGNLTIVDIRVFEQN